MSREVAALLEKLPPYQGKKRLIKSRQYTHDIITDIMRKHRETLKDYDGIADDFWKGNTYDTAYALFTFARRHLPYKTEPTLSQTSKTPAAILEERHIYGNDCKQYASFAVGIGEALRRQGHPVKCFYRFASYKKDSRTPGHVFAVFVDDNGEEIWVDPVPETGGFNKRYIKPVYKTDKMPPMSKNGHSIGALYDISGIPPNRIVAGIPPNRIVAGMHWTNSLPTSHGMGKAGKGKAKVKALLHKVENAPKKAIHDVKKGVQNTGKKIQKIQPGKAVKKVALSGSRNAYLLMVKVNAASMATDIHNKIRKNPANWQQLKKKWESLGGDSNKLNTAIDQGVAHYNKRHPNHHVSGVTNESTVSGFMDMYANPGDHMADGMGVAPALVAPAIIAAAAPIIAALAGLMKSFGVHDHPDTDDVEKADQAVTDDHNGATDTPGDGNKDITDNGSVDHGDGVTTKVTTDPVTGKQVIDYKVQPGEDGEEDDDDGTSTKTKTITKTKTKTGEGGFMAMLTNVTDFVSDHKTWFIVGGIALLAIIVLPKILGRKKPAGRKR